MSTSDHGHPWYVGVFLWLFVLTALEVGVTYLEMSRASLIIVLSGLGIAKAGLVAAYFMHLKFEMRKLIFFVTTPVVAILLMLIVVSVDALRIVPW
jgi:cytochrome c oxidase subunit 4